MASVDYMKVKTRAHLYNLIDHDAIETRLVKKHRNKHIDLTKTATENDQTWDAETARARFRARIDELDGTTNTNKRKDRVEAFSLEVNPPPGIPLDRQEIWLEDVYELIEGRVGEKNVIGGYIHGDELHEYRDARTGLKRMSRKELHMLVVPEIKGVLNGRKFSSPASMRAMNKAIEKMTQARYGVPFLTGEDPADPSIPYGTPTADLKMESELVQAVLDEHNGLIAQEREAARLEVQTERHEANELKAVVEQLEEQAETIVADALDDATEIRVEARKYASDTKKEADRDREQAKRDRNAAYWDAQDEREDADEYARVTRAKADQDAQEKKAQAERDAEATRKAAELDAARTRQEAERDAQAMRLQVDAMRKERDEAQADRDKAMNTRRATQAALQGDLETWAGLTSRPTAKGLLGVLGAAIEASRAKEPEPPKSEFAGAFDRMMAMMQGRQSQDVQRNAPELR